MQVTPLIPSQIISKVYPNWGTKTTTGLCEISDAHDTLSGSAFAWVHATTEDLPPPGPCPTGKQTAQAHALTKMGNLTRNHGGLQPADLKQYHLRDYLYNAR